MKKGKPLQIYFSDKVRKRLKTIAKLLDRPEASAVRFIINQRYEELEKNK